jgi:hypothetical protein
MKRYETLETLFRKVDLSFALTLTDPSTTIVSVTFQKLKHLCRFEKGGYCKSTWRNCEAQMPPNLKRQMKTV